MTTTAVRTKPILFSGPMVRAILDGRKTQTRRVVTGQALCWLQPGRFTPKYVAHPENHMCPYGDPGDLLWVREAWRYHDRVPISAMDGKGVARRNIVYRADAGNDGTTFRPSIHMPRWACRLWLRVTDVRVQRVQEISEEDALAEGSYLDRCPCFPAGRTPVDCVMDGAFRQNWCHKHGQAFRLLWDSINAKRGFGWDANPWVWAITFERTEAPR